MIRSRFCAKLIGNERASSVLPRAFASSSSWTANLDTGVVSHRQKGKQQFQTVIGLEIHAQLKIGTKLFSGCPIPQTSSLMQTPNSSVWPFDLGVPGFLPQLSQEAVHSAVLTAAATKCTIPQVSRFERKHYFYADLPLGYQVTQQRWPLAKDGVLVCYPKNTGKKGKNKRDKHNFQVRIERIQLEQDTGKTTSSTRKGQTESLVDFNRAGSALIEIVFHPDLRSANDAATTVETLRDLLVHIGTCDGKMEEGSLRCDLNVSIAPVDGNSLDSEAFIATTGNRVEVKNLNSLRQIVQAAQYEGTRQAEAAVKGTPTMQETRTFDVRKGKTVVTRTKGEAKDYRFMPEPDIPPIVLDADMFDGSDLQTYLDEALPELPEDARNRLVASYGLSEYLATVLTGDPPAIALFDEAVNVATLLVDDRVKKRVPETVANFLCNELFSLIRESQLQQMHHGDDESTPYSMIDGEQLGQLVSLVLQGVVSNTMAKQIIQILYEKEHGKTPLEVADAHGFKLITDSDELEQFCQTAIDENPDEMERYKLGGKFARKIIKFYVGKAMAASRGNAQPERLNEILLEVLEKVAPGVER